jgi:uncharacterized DUF497 family protein
MRQEMGDFGDVQIIWDLEDDPDGNVQHILEHGLSMDDVEDVLFNPANETGVSDSSGDPITFGYTASGEHIAVVWEHIMDDPKTIRPVTAYRVPEKRSRR